MFYLSRLAIADDDIRGAFENRRDEFRNICADILVVTVRVDDDIRSKLEAGIDTVTETASQSDVALVADDVVDADLTGYFNRAVGAAVIDDEDFHLVDPGNLPWDVRNCFGKRVLLVITGDLDDQLQGELLGDSSGAFGYAELYKGSRRAAVPVLLGYRSAANGTTKTL